MLSVGYSSRDQVFPGISGRFVKNLLIASEVLDPEKEIPSR